MTIGLADIKSIKEICVKILIEAGVPVSDTVRINDIDDKVLKIIDGSYELVTKS